MKFTEIYNEKFPNREIWISILVYCPYRAYLKNVMPRKQKKSVYMLSGMFLHQALQEEFSEIYEIEKRVEFDLGDGWKLAGKVDFYDPIENRVIEIKTVVNWKIKDEWIEQANLYAYLLNCPKFEIWVVLVPTGEINSKEFSMDRKKAEELVELAKKVVKGEKICKREYCKWCEYNDVCSATLAP
ncbi:MAG: Dna2/Cas4 domain-containing protein [Archaeoglobaceae archaeon]